MYKMTLVLATPEITDDEDLVYPLDLPNKKELNKVEKAFIKSLMQLAKLTEDELATGKKPFPPSDDRTMVTFDGKIYKGEVYYGGYHFDWPNQQPEAVMYLKGMLDGLMKETGHGHLKQRKKK